MRVWIGIDNGVTGSIGIVGADGRHWNFPTPTREDLSYTQTKQYVTRIDVTGLRALLRSVVGQYESPEVRVILERPMVNPARFSATLSAIRALEATLIVLEGLSLGYFYVDSRKWQSEILPKPLRADELKKASKLIGQRLFPDLKFGADADGILIAEWAKRRGL